MGQAGSVDDLENYVTASMEACGLADRYAQSKKDVSKSVALGQTIRTEAAKKPWYPKGYKEYYPSLAFKEANFNVDCYSRCLYWRYDVISKDGCPGGLYLEVQMTDSSDRVIDWTNESIQSLAPMQKARVLFKTYEVSANTWDFSDVSCY